MNHRISFLFFVLCLLVLPGLVLAGSPLDKVAVNLVKELDRSSSLAGKHVQLVADNFSEQSSSMVLPLSEEIVSSLTPALVQKGAIVSIHQQGDEPLTLAGSYRAIGKKLEIKVVLQLLARDGSRNLGAANETVALKKEVAPALLQKTLSSTVASLVEQLERSYPDIEESRFIVTQPSPANSGDPTRRVGLFLEKELEKTLHDSDVFGGKLAFGSPGQQVKVITTYSVSPVDDTVRFEVQMVDEGEEQLAHASGQIRSSELPSGGLDMVEDHGRTLCVEYVPGDRRSVPLNSPTVPHLLAELTSTLSAYNIKLVECGNETAVRVASALTINKKKMANGYGILLGTLSLQIFKGQSPAGTINTKQKQPYTGNANDIRTTLVDKLLNKEVQDQLVKKVLAW